jgi:hypothetical protein
MGGVMPRQVEITAVVSGNQVRVQSSPRMVEQKGQPVTGPASRCTAHVACTGTFTAFHFGR